MNFVKVEHVSQARPGRRGRQRDSFGFGGLRGFALRDPGQTDKQRRPRHEGHEGQARHQREQAHQHPHRGQRRRVAAQLVEELAVGCAICPATRQQKCGRDRDDDRRDLADQPVAHGQNGVGFKRVAQ